MSSLDCLMYHISKDLQLEPGKPGYDESVIVLGKRAERLLRLLLGDEYDSVMAEYDKAYKARNKI